MFSVVKACKALFSRSELGHDILVLNTQSWPVSDRCAFIGPCVGVCYI